MRACTTLQRALRIDFDLYDSNFKLLSCFRAETKYPSSLLSVLDLSAYFSDTLSAMQDYTGNVIYIHLVPAFYSVCYDFRIFATDGTLYYVSVGPFLQFPYSERLITQVINNFKLSSSLRPTLEAYYAHLSYYQENMNSTLAVIYSLLSGQTVLTDLPICTSRHPTMERNTTLGPFGAITPENSDILLDYREVMTRTKAIRRGDYKAAATCISAGNQDWNIVRPGTTPLRTAKNLHYSTNGINRMAAVEGGADPLEVHHTSEKFCVQLEALSNEYDMQLLERETIKKYCNLVIKNRSRSYTPLVQKAVQYIYAYYDTSLTLEKVADAIHCSWTYLSRVFNRETGLTLGEYLNHLRIEFAASMLESGDLPITEIALSVGFSSYNKFSVAFKKQLGCSASAYRKRAIESKAHTEV